MNAKYALALILALQVSVSLCEIPTPSQELVQKYDEMKATFYKRLLNLYDKLQAAAAPMLEKVGGSVREQAVKDFTEDLQTKPEFQDIMEVATALGEEAGPLVDKARTSVLGLYEYHMRPRFGEHISNMTDDIKVFLDKYMPTE